MNKMDVTRIDQAKAGKIVFLVLFLIIFYAIAATYYRTYIAKNYIIETEIECDPTTERCYASICDPADDPECPENEEERASYYKLIKKKRANISDEMNNCNSHEIECPELSCEPEETNCQMLECDPEKVGEPDPYNTEERECSDPEQYNLDHPDEESLESEEDGSACNPEEDDECLVEEDASSEDINAENNLNN